MYECIWFWKGYWNACSTSDNKNFLSYPSLSVVYWKTNACLILPVFHYRILPTSGIVWVLNFRDKNYQTNQFLNYFSDFWSQCSGGYINSLESYNGGYLHCIKFLSTFGTMNQFAHPTFTYSLLLQKWVLKSALMILETVYDIKKVQWEKRIHLSFSQFHLSCTRLCNIKCPWKYENMFKNNKILVIVSNHR